MFEAVFSTPLHRAKQWVPSMSFQRDLTVYAQCGQRVKAGSLWSWRNALSNFTISSKVIFRSLWALFSDPITYIQCYKLQIDRWENEIKPKCEEYIYQYKLQIDECEKEIKKILENKGKSSS